ncbi:lysophospholipase, partial [bacterium]|nr:lysophospholipase [bacterium]
GKSQGTRVFIDSFDDFISNVKLLFDQVKKWEPGKKIFLVGHSMGGLIGAAYLLKYQNELSGAVISAPAIKPPDGISKITLFAANVLSKILPKTGIQKLDAKGVSSDPQVVKEYIDDPLVCSQKITARLVVELLSAMENVSANASKIVLPLIVVQGGADILVDPDGAKMLYDRAGSKQKTLQIYDDFFHEVFNEPDHIKVFNDIESWLEKQLE